MIPQKDLEKQLDIFMEPIILLEFVKNTITPFLSIRVPMNLDKMIVSAGEVGHSIIIAPQDLAKLCKSELCRYLGGKPSHETLLCPSW